MVVTSPPYPMVEMWDDIMGRQNIAISKAQIKQKPNEVFELMHQELDKVWKECFRVLAEGGFLCINIGDATRTVNGNFKLYDNHSRIAQYCNSIGFNEMPCVLWRKETNAPNKFMGSGMLPCGAYVTLEHEYILIFRK
ncbi:MAG: DNA methyltransferase, partial [Chitinophagaceae bacterium]